MQEFNSYGFKVIFSSNPKEEILQRFSQALDALFEELLEQNDEHRLAVEVLRRSGEKDELAPEYSQKIIRY